MSSPESISQKPLIEIQSLFRKKLEEMAYGKSQSVHGARPDEEGRYSASRSDDKETREILVEALKDIDLLTLNEKGLLSKFPSAEDYIRAFGADIQSYPEPIFSPILTLIKMEFDLDIPLRNRNEVRFDNSIFILRQMVDLPEAELRERLGHGKLPFPEEHKIQLDLRRTYPKKT
jgi:hypothetical protein